jgi:beta-galactosidase
MRLSYHSSLTILYGGDAFVIYRHEYGLQYREPAPIKKGLQDLHRTGTCGHGQSVGRNHPFFRRRGGTVVMSAYSAKVNEHNRVFDTTLPGELSDVFGIRIGAFMRTRSHTPTENAGGLEKTELHLEREKPTISFGGSEYRPYIDYYEILEPHTTEAEAVFANTRDKSPAVTRNRYGEGEALYVAIPANTGFLVPLLDSLYPALGIEKGPAAPPGVVARKLEDGTLLYVNTTGEANH